MAVVRARSTPPYAAVVGFVLFGAATVAAVGSYFMYASAAEEVTRLNSQLDSRQKALSDATTAKTDLETRYGEASTASQRDKDALAKQTAAMADLQAQIKRAQEQANNDAKALSAARDEFTKALTALRTEKEKYEGQVAQLNKDRDAAVAKGEQSVEQAISELEERSRDRVLELEQLRSDLAKLSVENAELKKRIGDAGGQQGVPTVGEPDGTIVRANHSTGEVIISLGRKDRIVPGLTFTAYDPRLGVRFGTEDAAAGNGSIEVIEVGEETSRARITRSTPNKVIQANDLIANIVYQTNKTRQFRFVVRGDFDLDGDGAATAAERERIVRLITAWGGKVEDTVNSQTDYVVAGVKPPAIASVELTPDGELTAAAPTAPEPGSVADQRQKEQQSYDEALVEAKRMSIPVLNANRFLAMVGYYNTTIVRYGAAK